jgi:hypothetical protein
MEYFMSSKLFSHFIPHVRLADYVTRSRHENLQFIRLQVRNSVNESNHSIAFEISRIFSHYGLAQNQANIRFSLVNESKLLTMMTGLQQSILDQLLQRRPDLLPGKTEAQLLQEFKFHLLSADQNCLDLRIAPKCMYYLGSESEDDVVEVDPQTFHKLAKRGEYTCAVSIPHVQIRFLQYISVSGEISSLCYHVPNDRKPFMCLKQVQKIK